VYYHSPLLYHQQKDYIIEEKPSVNIQELPKASGN
jgi:hypothetical protein